MVGEQCHALRLRLGRPATDAELTARLATAGPWQLWVEHVAAPADGPEAHRLRDVELSRPTSAVRCVVLRHGDGVADLVLVADRAVLDEEGLHDLAAILA